MYLFAEWLLRCYHVENLMNPSAILYVPYCTVLYYLYCIHVLNSTCHCSGMCIVCDFAHVDYQVPVHANVKINLFSIWLLFLKVQHGQSENYCCRPYRLRCFSSPFWKTHLWWFAFLMPYLLFFKQMHTKVSENTHVCDIFVPTKANQGDNTQYPLICE